jgi:hypothetical protein
MIPETTPGLRLSAVLGDDIFPETSLSIVRIDILTRYPEENMVIDPFRQGSNPMSTKNISASIGNFSVNPSS